MTHKPNALPKSAFWLGLAGLLPQLLACMFALVSREWNTFVILSGFAYPALIFSFLGGVWWGNALSAGRAPAWIFVAAVCPSLIGFASALLIFSDLKWWPSATSTLAIGLIVSPLIDKQIARSIEMPDGWMNLRWLLSISLGLLTLLLVALHQMNT